MFSVIEERKVLLHGVPANVMIEAYTGNSIGHGEGRIFLKVDIAP
jgi:hypothetical protein